MILAFFCIKLVPTDLKNNNYHNGNGLRKIGPFNKR